MRIEALHLINFRGFKSLDFEFPKSNVAVFIGVNGAGKSSILDSIGAVLSSVITRFTNNRRGRLILTDDDIYAEASELTIRIQLNEFYRAEIEWTLERSRDRETKLTCSSVLGSPFPVLVYYPANRLIHSSDANPRAKTKTSRSSQSYTYENAFSREISNFEDFLSWFRLEEDLENQIISRENRNYVNPSLEVVRDALATFFSELQIANFSNLRVVRQRTDWEFSSLSSLTSSLEIDKDGKPLKIEQLSSGEKTLFIIVCDLARRLAIANSDSSHVYGDGSGIVLIDEIDNHLHPQWQRQILSALTTTFPNCQFITTTHSPQVLSNLLPEEIFVLDNEEISNNISYSFGRDSNSILYEFMGVEKRPEWMRHLLDRAFQMIDEGNIEAAKSEIEKLKQSLGQNDPDIVRANTLLQFLYE